MKIGRESTQIFRLAFVEIQLGINASNNPTGLSDKLQAHN